MNEKYLWDKIGTDAEIEKLENALQTLRYQETPAPRIPAEIIAAKSKAKFSFLRFGFAFATGCVVLVIVGVSVWSYVSGKHSNVVAVNSVKVIEPNSPTIIQPLMVESPKITTGEPPQIAPIKAVQIVQRSPKQKFVKARKSFPAVYLKSEKTNAAMTRTETVAQLSGEEKYAYSQLMLALSITSSKLKIVKEKVDGAENSSAVSNGGK